MNGTTVEAKDTKCAGAPPSRDGENLVERSGLAGEGEHSDDEDPADGALSTLSGDAEMVRAEVVAGVTEAGLVLKPQVEEDRSESAVENAPSLDRLFTSEELDLLMEGETLGAGCDPVPVHGEVDKSVVRGNILICMKGTAVSTSKADGDEKALHGSRFYMLSTVDWYG
ncbi:hypothetical protein PF001_g17401 [Phytophthora fragariae]|nr:hypothetical protein PF009_g6534 [Phytophthora fragariae]KAE9125095.1 hypothetical protein PF006_g17040 [Phytophthora fragariae]KAE9295259.1 hypothetical protein PF001_g17401 [Phytophthora fragariae]